MSLTKVSYSMITGAPANVLDYGAKGDGSTNDTNAIQLALDSGATSIFFPTGVYNINRINVPSTIETFFGEGEGSKFVGVGSLPAYEPYIYFDTLSGFDVYGFSIDVDSATYLTNHALFFGACNNGRVENIRVIDGGYIGVYVSGCGGVTFRDILIDDYYSSGFRTGTASIFLTLDNIKISQAGLSHSIQIDGGNNHKIVNCTTYLSGPTVFGINLLNVSNAIVSNNSCTTDTIEGINVQDSTFVNIVGNTVYCLAGHQDFGISLFAATAETSHNLIVANRVYFSGKSGIALASTTFACKQNHVLGNLIISPNQLDEAMWGGVTLYGSTLCSENTIQDNRLVDEGNTAKYGVNEYNDGGGNPQLNYLIDNPSLTYGAGFIAPSYILTATSQIWDLTKTIYTPTVTSSSGTITAYTATGSYCQRGKFILMSLSINVTTNGTGAGYITVTTPFTQFAKGVLNGADASNNKQISGTASTTSVRVSLYDGTYPATSGSLLVLSGVMELI